MRNRILKVVYDAQYGVVTVVRRDSERRYMRRKSIGHYLFSLIARLVKADAGMFTLTEWGWVYRPD